MGSSFLPPMHDLAVTHHLLQDFMKQVVHCSDHLLLLLRMGSLVLFLHDCSDTLLEVGVEAASQPLCFCQCLKMKLCPSWFNDWSFLPYHF